jgi:3-hydroxyisobutyrate dehydrogenase-like beta-hydroxyacid dehydrogenase
VNTQNKNSEIDFETYTTEGKTLGLIGVGHMGQPIAKRLLSHGYRVIVFDHTRERAEELVPHGATAAFVLAELVGNADIILSSLPDDATVLDVYGGRGGVFANARPGTVVIEMSTVRPSTSREIYEGGKYRELHVLDVAISGSTPAAKTGALTLLAGGDRPVFNAVSPIFGAIAKQYFYLGASGSGTTMKLVANTLLGVGMQAIAEAAVLGEKAGIERNLLFDVMAKLAVIAPAHVGKLERAKNDDYSAQFPIQLMNKDFRLILEKAAEVHACMPVTAAAFQINNVESAGGADEDFSAVIRRMEQLAQLQPEARTVRRSQHVNAEGNAGVKVA